mmetsp:Transcript_61363/g.163159  ORF Transcript_61363/g.163159 Transcript_61363/m.163159 type:complete len:306 (+) Transcript_61363:614-1531(+)
MSLPLLCEDLRESSCGSRCHLSENGLARPVADGAGSILPHDGALVHEASQGWLHERVPARNAALSKQLHHVVSDIQRKAAVCFDGVWQQEPLHHLHEWRQPYRDELVGIGAHEGACNVRQAKPCRLSGRDVLQNTVIVVIVLGLLALSLLPSCLRRFILRDAELTKQLHHNVDDGGDLILREHAFASLRDDAAHTHGLRLKRTKGHFVQGSGLRSLCHGRYGRLQELTNQLANVTQLDGTLVRCRPRHLCDNFPRLERLLPHHFGKLEVEQRQKVLACFGKELAEILVHGLDQSVNHCKSVLHLF